MAIDPTMRVRGRGGVRVRTNEQVLFNPLCFVSVEELLAGLSNDDWFRTHFASVEVAYRPRRQEELADRTLLDREYGRVELRDGHLFITCNNVFVALGLLQFWQFMLEDGKVPA